MEKKIVAIIPARGGSKGVPRKNIRPLDGKPLIAHTIESAQESAYISEIVVSTDDLKIADVSQAYGAATIMRPAAMATDNAPSEEALMHAVKTLEQQKKFKIDLIVFLQATAPLRPSGLVDQCIDKLIRKRGDSLLTVSFDHMFYWIEKEGWGTSIHDYRQRPMRQEATEKDLIYREKGSVYIMKRHILMEGGNRLGGKIVLFPMAYEDCFGIDTEFDFWLVERVLEWKTQQ